MPRPLHTAAAADEEPLKVSMLPNTAVPLRVLAVDDNADALDSLAILIRLWGHEVRTAYDGRAAQAAAPEFRPAVALLDLGLPRMDGCELGRRLRELPGLGGLMLLAVTGHADEEYRRRAREAGFAFYFVKAGGPEWLEATLGAMARKKEGKPPVGGC
jgi:two-component system CheB/CheR fusion protein